MRGSQPVESLSLEAGCHAAGRNETSQHLARPQVLHLKLGRTRRSKRRASTPAWAWAAPALAAPCRKSGEIVDPAEPVGINDVFGFVRRDDVEAYTFLLLDEQHR